MKSNNKKTGFTLIEILVVVSIIGLLSSMVLAALNEAKLRARASAMAQDIYQLRKAIELYRTSKGTPPGILNAYYSTADQSFNILISSLVPEYISNVPKPANNEITFEYYRVSPNNPFSCGSTKFGDYVLEILPLPQISNETAKILGLTNLPKENINGTLPPMDVRCITTP